MLAAFEIRKIFPGQNLQKLKDACDLIMHLLIFGVFPTAHSPESRDSGKLSFFLKTKLSVLKIAEKEIRKKTTTKPGKEAPKF